MAEGVTFFENRTDLLGGAGKPETSNPLNRVHAADYAGATAATGPGAANYARGGGGGRPSLISCVYPIEGLAAFWFTRAA